MKKIYLLFLLFVSFFANSQEPFITTWEVTEGDLSIEIEISSNTANYSIDYGDGTIFTDVIGNSSHIYDSPGIYTVSMSGNIERLSLFGNNGKLLSIEQWGDIEWTSMENAFASPDLVINATDAPDLSQVTSLRYMFEYCTSVNQPINHWDVSNVTDMFGMFRAATAFNQSLDEWDVSNVTDMTRMFEGASSFNQSIAEWDVSQVMLMDLMFHEATAFNQPINDWNVSNVTSMEYMFASATSFDQPLNNWNVSNVTNMAYMFAEASSFSQPLSEWDVSNVTSFGQMFSWTDFDQDLSSWEFNDEAFFSLMIADSGLSPENYESLLLGFLQSGMEGKTLHAYNLEYCDPTIRDYLITERNWVIDGDFQGESCQGNLLIGGILFDEDGNGCSDEDTLALGHFLVRAGSGEISYGSTFTNGIYSLQVFENTYDVSLLNLPSYFTATPATSEITFEGFGNEETLNFCLTANETVNDLNITLLPLEEARPGFETEYQLVVQNMGTQSVPAATVTLSFDDTLQTFLSADPAPATTTANQLTFALADLQPFESRMINLTTELFTPPTVNGGEISTFTATVTPNDDDYTAADNTFVLEQEVVNSYDPNDKTVLQGERIYIEQADEYLNYIIRFQNTGTASAITVRIEDILHDNLDWTTFTPISASHGYRVAITDGNLVEFIFDDINLPHEAADAPGSNGFVAYKIKPVADIQVGDIMEGNASIFFDYNLPIITNVATTEVITPMVVTVTQAGASCHGESDGSASVNVSGGSEDYTYEWSSDEGTAPTADGLAAGDYTVTIINSYGESITVPVTITQPGAMTVSSQPADVAASTGGNASFSVTAANVDGYQWQVSDDGENWNGIANGGTAPSYSGAETATLSMTGIPLAFDGYYYRAMLENGEECETYSSTAILEVSDVAGLENLSRLTVTMYPNPARTEVFIAIPGSAGHHNLRLSVDDISGRQLVEKPVSADLEKVDLSGFASGMYLFTISSATGRFTQQLIKE